MSLWWVSLPWATFGIVSHRGRVVEAPPIAEWAVGQPAPDVIQHYAQRGAKIVQMLTPEQERELARQQRTERAISTALNGSRVANRHHNEGPDLRKQKFVDAFIQQGRIDDYPFDAADILDENQALHEEAQAEDGEPNPAYDAEYVYEPKEVTMDEAMKREVARAFRLHGDPKHVDPGVLAHELLSSEHGDELCRIRDTPLHVIELDLILAHLESLGYGLDKRLSVSVARRTFMTVLNRRWYRDDGKRKEQAQS